MSHARRAPAREMLDHDDLAAVLLEVELPEPLHRLEDHRGRLLADLEHPVGRRHAAGREHQEGRREAHPRRILPVIPHRRNLSVREFR